MRRNAAPQGTPTVLTFEGTPSARLSAVEQLHRTMASCLLWEKTFYEDGEVVAERLKRLTLAVPAATAAELAVKGRHEYKLRHAPLLMVRTLMQGTPEQRKAGETVLPKVIVRADELSEFLAIYWDGKDRKTTGQKLANGVKRGLARAFGKFDEYALAKYNRDATVRLRDVLRLVHPRPKDEAQSALWKRVLTDELATPDTWETQLSAGADKATTFTRLINEQKIGALAVLRNLRNMVEAKVPDEVIRKALLEMKTEWVLPFRFIAAARYAPKFEPELEQAMFKCLAEMPKLPGTTALVVDTSPSMLDPLSAKSDMSRLDAASGLAILARELCERCNVYAFNEKGYVVPGRHGFALRDALARTMGNASFGNRAVELANADGYDRIIVLTDGEWHLTDAYGSGDSKKVILDPLTPKAYLINVAVHTNAVGTDRWVMLDGWSESVLTYVNVAEQFYK